MAGIGMVETNSQKQILQRQDANALGVAALLAVAAFVSPLFALCLSLFLFTGNPTRKQALACAFGVAVAMSLIVSGIEYRHPVDVTRWIAECQFYTGQGPVSVLSSSNPDHEGLLIWNIWCWIVGNSGNMALLQTSGAFIGFGLVSWMLMDACARENTEAIAFLALFVFVVLAVHMQAIVAYMRSTIGCILCATAFYLRRSCARNPTTGALICAVGLAAVASAATYLITSHVLDGLPLIGDAIRKASIYTEGTNWDQEQANNSIAIIGHILSMALLVVLLFRSFLTSQNDYRFPAVLVMSFCVFAMEVTLVNVGNRLMYIPLLIGSTLCLSNEERKRLSEKRWPLLLDLGLFVLALLVCLIAFSDFIPSFNYAEVAKYAVFYPAILL